MSIADTPDPLDGYLTDWAQYMRSGKGVSEGYPRSSIGLRSGGVIGDFDQMVADEDAKVAEVTNTLIDDLVPAERCALHNRYLAAVYRFGGREDAALKLQSARENVRTGLKRKGVWVG